MGNENQINDKVEHEVNGNLNQFLPANVPGQEIEADKYHLEEEYSKTKKNKSYVVYLSVLLFLAFITGVTFLITNVMQKKSKTSNIGITEYQNINLQDLLDDSKNKAKRLKNLQLELERTKNRLLADVSKVKIKYSSAREQLLSQNLSTQERKIQLNKINQKEKNEITKIQKDASKKIKAQEKEIRKLKEELRIQNLKMRSGMSKADAIVNNYKELNKMKLAKQKADYEKKIRDLILKYNPKFRNKNINRILKQKYSTKNIKNLISLKNALAKERAISKAEIQEITSLINNFNTLSNRFDKIQYRNSIPKGLNTLTKINNSIIYKLDQYSNRLKQIVLRQNSLLYKYNLAFQHLAKSTAEGGYIINASNKNSLLIYINPIIQVNKNQIGMIFRQDDEYIGKLQIIHTGQYKTAKIIELSKGKKIKPFDKIIMKAQ